MDNIYGIKEMSYNNCKRYFHKDLSVPYSLINKLWTWRYGIEVDPDSTHDYVETYDLYDDKKRLKSLEESPFSHCRIKDMALTGFYYHVPKGKTVCMSCELEVDDWHPDESPMAKHWILRPDCSYLQNDEMCRQYAPKHLNYHDLQKRIDSFSRWDRPPAAESMAEAGFFYTGIRDMVKCFYCDISLDNWKHDDQPWEEHKFWASGCHYVKIMRELSKQTECRRVARLGRNVETDARDGFVSIGKVAIRSL